MLVVGIVGNLSMDVWGGGEREGRGVRGWGEREVWRDGGIREQDRGCGIGK